MSLRCIKPSDPELYTWDRRFPTGRLEIKLKKKNFTVINYYNKNPDKAIPVRGQPHTYYLHSTLPAYLVYIKGKQYVGTYEEIEREVNK